MKTYRLDSNGEIITILIRGEMFYFEDNTTDKQKNDLQHLADTLVEVNPDFKACDNKTLCTHLIDAAKKQLGIDLIQYRITQVIRMNAPFSF